MKAEQERLPDPHIEGAENIAVSVIELEDYPDIDPAFFEEFTKPNADRMKLFELAYSSGVIGCDTYDLFSFSANAEKPHTADFSVLCLKLMTVRFCGIAQTERIVPAVRRCCFYPHSEQAAKR